MQKERVIVFIDGFNLYHAVSKHFPIRYKWCNLKALIQQFLIPEKQELKGTYFFTAYCAWDETKKKRHKNTFRRYKQMTLLQFLGNTEK